MLFLYLVAWPQWQHTPVEICARYQRTLLERVRGLAYALKGLLGSVFLSIQVIFNNNSILFPLCVVEHTQFDRHILSGYAKGLSLEVQLH